MEQTGKRVRTLRVQLGYTQEELANKIGIKQNSLSGIESGSRRPGQDVLTKLCDQLNTSAEYLLGLTDDPHAYRKEIPDFTAHLPKTLADAMEDLFCLASADEVAWMVLQSYHWEDIGRIIDDLLRFGRKPGDDSQGTLSKPGCDSIGRLMNEMSEEEIVDSIAAGCDKEKMLSVAAEIMMRATNRNSGGKGNAVRRVTFT